jgi:DNA-directed RNA polymerase III subunit RPC1
MKVLNNIRNDAGKACLAELPRYNSPMIMAQCGSKGVSAWPPHPLLSP